MAKAINHVLAFASLLLLTSSYAFAQDRTVDYAADVQPILETHCYRCHSEQQQHGGLRLDQKNFAEHGGTTGGTILGGDLKKNLLLARISSEDESLRMPLGEPPLSPKEVKTLQAWTELGSPWPEPPAPKLSWEKWLDKASDSFQRYRIQSFLFIALMLVYLLSMRVLGQRKDSSVPHSSKKLISVICLLLLAAVVTSIVIQEFRSLQREIARLNDRISQFQGETSLNAPGKPIVPIQAKQLEGTYYRGNDERRLELFNGGFYRTATFHVSLQDPNGKVLTYGSNIEEDSSIAIQVEIERAPFAAQRLFTDPLVTKASLSNPNESYKKKIGIDFEIIDSGERWASTISIGTVTADCELNGKIQLVRSIPHYELPFNIKVVDGKITGDSEIRMISLFQTANLVRRPTGMILENEWFSARPIPVIVGGNSTDPEHLGIDEHIKSGLIPKNDSDH